MNRRNQKGWNRLALAFASGNRLAGLVSISLLVSGLATATPLAVKIGVIRMAHSKETLSLLDVPADNEFLAGAMLGVADDNSNGRFTGQTYTLDDIELKPGGNVAAAYASLAGKGDRLIVADLPAAQLLTLSDLAKKDGALIFNAGASDDRLRQQDCRANIIHAAPSRSMLTDALTQYLMWKRWTRWLLVRGSHKADQALAQAYRNSARKFGAKIVGELLYKDTGGSRRSDSGSVQVQQQIPVLTQNTPTYDVMIAADESEVFGGYLPYRTWDPRPVAGSAGLMPTVWDGEYEQWGAVQLQNRFQAMFKRTMDARDYLAWMSARMIGEAVTRTGQTTPEGLRAYLISPKFDFAAFKSESVSVRSWDQQVRQPILLSDGRSLVSVSPQRGYLNPNSDLDTLGVDQPESKCKL